MPKPDTHFDIDALFAHLTEDLEHDPEDELEWHFDFRSDDVEKLTRIGEGLTQEFEVYLQEEVETVTDEGTSIGPPLLTVVIEAALQPDEVKELAARFEELAREEGLTYEGVSTFEPFDEDEAFGWMDLEGANWRLRHFADSGLAQGEPVPFVFAIHAENQDALNGSAAALQEAGFSDLELIEDEEGMGIILHVEGKNDEALLTSVYEEVERIADAAGGELIGVQFFDDEDEDEQEGDEEE
ncbi:MAG TPA: ribonuclease E inhibitor RraB [Phycisphaerales bacterium]|nr:ribonuclease E inhibitor RraB [Phycisphaerales bacterium]